MHSGAGGFNIELLFLACDGCASASDEARLRQILDDDRAAEQREADEYSAARQEAARKERRAQYEKLKAEFES